jgi:hypothetical protein
VEALRGRQPPALGPQRLRAWTKGRHGTPSEVSCGGASDTGLQTTLGIPRQNADRPLRASGGTPQDQRLHSEVAVPIRGCFPACAADAATDSQPEVSALRGRAAD